MATTNRDKYIYNSKDNLGYLEGYDIIAEDEGKPNVKVANKTVVDNNNYMSDSIDEFKNSISKEKNDKNGFEEDPLLLGYKITFMKDTPLFKMNDNNNSTNSTKKFLNLYNNIPEINTRIGIHEKFVEVFNTMFEYDIDNTDNTIKDYMIETISGLGNLNKKIFNPAEDYITVTLSENVSMNSLYLAELYNNLVYDYNGMREMIPENCLRFNMTIKLNDLRIFKKIVKGSDIGYEIDDNQSSMTFTLYDCKLDFFESMVNPTEITMNGYGASLSGEVPNLSFKIHYKSVERLMTPSSIDNANYLDNKEILKSNRSNDKLGNDVATGTGAKDNIEYLGKIKSNKLKNLSDSKFGLGNIIDEKSFTDKISKTFKNALEDAKDKLLQKVRKLRGNLINNILGEVREGIGIHKIYPDNVYDENFRELTLKNFYESLKSNLYEDVESSVRSGVNDFFNDLGI